MVIVVFRNRFKPDADLTAYLELALKMYELVSRHPGFISMESFQTPDDEHVSIEYFDSDESAVSWRNHPEHLEAQRRGREEFYSWYSVSTSEVTRSHEMNLSGDHSANR